MSDRGFPGGLSKASLIGELDGKSILTPYQVTTRFERRRALAATLSDTLYVYDFLEVRMCGGDRYDAHDVDLPCIHSRCICR